MGNDLDQRIAYQADRSAFLMQKAISATHLLKERPIFSEHIRPIRGSVLASPVMGNWDPDPDYFFSWPRDTAMVMNAITVRCREARSAVERDHWARHFRDIVRFSLGVLKQDGTKILAKRDFRAVTDPNPLFIRYARTHEVFSAIKGDLIHGEARVNPDGTPSGIHWSEPQYDGPASRASACIAYADLCREQGRKVPRSISKLIERDLKFTIAHAGEACIGLWEERKDEHYYTLVVQLGAMHHGAAWAQANGHADLAKSCRTAEDLLRTRLENHWHPNYALYIAGRRTKQDDPSAMLDTAAIMAAVHARLPYGRHSVADDRIHATLAQLEDMFDRDYPINRNRAKDEGVAMGRYRGDVYFSGGAYYFCSLNTAEFYYTLAKNVALAQTVQETGSLTMTPVNEAFREKLLGPVGAGDTRAQALALFEKADSMMRTVLKYTPEDGSLAEQFSQVNGAPTSAKHLTWSYAAFITAAAARRAALAAIGPVAAPSPSPSPSRSPSPV